MPTLEAPASAKIPDKPFDHQLPVPRRVRAGRDGSTEVLQRCLDLAVSGNQAANRTIRNFVSTVDKVAPLEAVGPARQLERVTAALEMTQRLAHAPFDLGRTLVHSTVLVDVDVDVDVDVASQQCAPQESDQEEAR